MEPATSKQEENPKSESETREWLDLPKDVMIHIFLKLGVIELLYNAQSVCSSWRKLAKEPQLYRCIDMRDPWDYFYEWDPNPVTKMALEAIDRSCGQLVEISTSSFCTDEVLQRIVVDNSRSLRRLRLASCYLVSEDAFIEVLKKLSLLEELELCLCSFASEVIGFVGGLCPHLKSFRLKNEELVISVGSPSMLEDCNSEALAIAANMPQLRRLQLFGNTMNENGLRAILEKCHHLEYLDLRQCFCINFDEELRHKCKEIQTLRLPYDSTDDCEFDATMHHSLSFESDEDVASGYDDYVYVLSDLVLFDEDGDDDIDINDHEGI